MLEKTPETGTPPEGTDDSANAGTPADADDSESGEDKVTITRGELKSWKGKAEGFNAIAEENRRMKAERESRTSTDHSGSEAGDLRSKLAARESRMERLRVAAKGGNEDSQVLVDTLEIAQEAEQRQLYRLEMSDVPESKRSSVKDFMKERRLSSPAAAYRFMRGGEADTLESENQRLREELDTIKKPRPKPESTKMPGNAGKGLRSISETNAVVVSPGEYSEGMSDPETRKKLNAARREKRLTIKM